MNDMTTATLPAIGEAFAGGYFAGRIKIGDQTFALVVAPKADGEHADSEWSDSENRVEGALSYFDGMKNTEAMAAAGSDLAKWARGLRIGGFDDWYLPSQDEMELCYRNLKPTTEKNWMHARSGINLSALPPAYPYTADSPRQTALEAFKQGREEASSRKHTGPARSTGATQATPGVSISTMATSTTTARTTSYECVLSAENSVIQ